MMDNNQLNPKLLTIGQLFNDSDSVYTVPIYQRNYAWQAEHIEQLLRDILDAICNEEDSYFLGNLIVTERQGTTNNFEVIDGQQRLTTLYLLLTILAERGFVSKKDLGCLSYESRPRATKALQRISTLTRDSSLLPESSNNEDAGIHQGYNIIRQFMAQYIDGDSKQFAEFLCTKVQMVRASLPCKTDFNRYFEIMNTRGQQLQQTDIVKARLMHHFEDEAQRACFGWIWDACSDMDYYVQMSLTRGDTDLRKKIFGDDWSWLTQKSFEDLVEAHKPPDSNTAESTPSSTSLTLDEALAKYAKVSVHKDGGDENNMRFRSTIEFPTFLLHVLKVVNGDGEEVEGRLDDKSLIKEFERVLKDQGTKASKWVQNFAFKLLRCRNIFDSFVIKRQYTATYSDDGDWSLQRLIKRGSNSPEYIKTFSRSSDGTGEEDDIDSATNDLLTLQSMLRVTYTSPQTMHWITLLLKLLDESELDKLKESELAVPLREYARGKVRDAFFISEEPTGFSINRIVFTYLDYLIWSDRQDPNYRFSFRNSIEHFYPQNPSEKKPRTPVSQEWLHRLGNLALVSVGVNSQFSNSPPNVKASIFQATIEKQSPKLQEMAEMTRNRSEWGDKEVIEHHKAVLKRLKTDLGL